MGTVRSAITAINKAYDGENIPQSAEYMLETFTLRIGVIGALSNYLKHLEIDADAQNKYLEEFSNYLKNIESS